MPMDRWSAAADTFHGNNNCAAVGFALTRVCVQAAPTKETATTGQPAESCAGAWSLSHCFDQSGVQQSDCLVDLRDRHHQRRHEAHCTLPAGEQEQTAM